MLILASAAPGWTAELHTDAAAEKLYSEGAHHLQESYADTAVAQKADIKAKPLIEAACKDLHACKFKTWSDDQTVCREGSVLETETELKDGKAEDAKRANEESKKAEIASRRQAFIAYDFFRQASEVNPVDARYPLAEAYALNQAARYREALASIKQAIKLHYGTQSNLLSAEATAHINDPASSRDEVQIGVNELTQALREKKQEPGIDAAEIQGLQDQLSAAQNKLDGMNDSLHLALWTRTHPNLGTVGCDVIPPQQELPVNLSVYSGYGFNDNITKGRTHPEPTGTQRGSVSFNESSLTLNYLRQTQHPYYMGVDRQSEAASEKDAPADGKWLPQELALSDLFTINYAFISDTYDRRHGADLLYHTLSAGYQHTFTPWITATARATETLQIVEQDLSLNQISALVGVTVSPYPRTSTQFSFTGNRQDGLNEPAFQSDPDGFTYQLQMTESLTLLEDPSDEKAALTLNLTYAHQFINVVGVLGRSQFDDYSARLAYEWRIHHAASFVRSVGFALSEDWSPTQSEYDLFKSADGAGLYARYDEQNKFIASVVVRMWYDKDLSASAFTDGCRLQFFAQYTRTDLHSNVTYASYDANSFTAYVQMNF